ncbi:MAG: hypothetical protein K8I30_19770 [Anaerolineae bacterium]|nr:hypothetical protein [Anaerolineae bacterium]
MNTIRKIALTIGILVLLAALAVPTLAADVTKTVTVTETQINDSYWVTNPAWRAVSDRSVDLQAGQVVVSETITPRKGDPVAVSITYTASVSNGRILWTAAAMTKNGEAVSQELLDQINAHMSSSWARYWKNHRQPGRVTAFDISEDAITVTLTSKR